MNDVLQVELECHLNWMCLLSTCAKVSMCKECKYIDVRAGYVISQDITLLTQHVSKQAYLLIPSMAIFIEKK